MVCCVRLTDNMMCNIQAFELAMASTASTVDIEDGPIPMKEMYIEIQWNPCTTDTISTNNFVSYSEVSPTQGLPVYMSGRHIHWYKMSTCTGGTSWTTG